MIARFVAASLAGLLLAQSGHADSDGVPKDWEFFLSLPHRTGDVALPDAGAVLHVGSGFRYVERAEVCKASKRLCASVPGLGILVPDAPELKTEAPWLIKIRYVGGGYVSDEDYTFVAGQAEGSGADADPAESPTPEDLREFQNEVLAQLREVEFAANAPRNGGGRLNVESIDWAMAPRYDQPRNMLAWAVTLRLEGQVQEVVNFKARLLGRHGHLQLRANASSSDYAVIKEGMLRAVGMVEFASGKRYGDYRPGQDRRASYDLMALVIGKPFVSKQAAMLVNAILIALALALLGVAAAIWKLFGRRRVKPDAVS